MLVIRTSSSSNTQPVRTDTQHLPAGGIRGDWTVALSTAMTRAFPEQAQPKESTFVSPWELSARRRCPGDAAWAGRCTQPLGEQGGRLAVGSIQHHCLGCNLVSQLIQSNIKAHGEIRQAIQDKQSSRVVKQGRSHSCPEGRCPCSWQGGWNQMIFKVPSNPNHSIIL